MDMYRVRFLAIQSVELEMTVDSKDAALALVAKWPTYHANVRCCNSTSQELMPDWQDTAEVWKAVVLKMDAEGNPLITNFVRE